MKLKTTKEFAAVIKCYKLGTKIRLRHVWGIVFPKRSDEISFLLECYCDGDGSRRSVHTFMRYYLGIFYYFPFHLLQKLYSLINKFY